MAQILYTFDNPPSERDLKKACKCLEDEGIIAYQTDLNWAIGCDATNPNAINKLRKIKPSHSKESPFTIMCDSISTASDIGHIDSVIFRYLKKAWPGPYTVILQSTRILPKQIADKRKTVGIRIPGNNMVLALIEMYGKPMVTTSVQNHLFAYEEVERHPKFGHEVEEVIGHQIDLILDLGIESPGEESTIISFHEGYPELIREGAGDPKVFDLT